MNIHSKLSQVGWGALQTQYYGRIWPMVVEIQGNTADIRLDYRVSTPAARGLDIYDVKEFFRIRRADADTTYVLGYDRYVDQLFDGLEDLNDSQTIIYGAEALKTYFFGFVFMSFMFTGQSTFTALGYSKHAIFFSLLRKVIIVTPLAIILPRIGFGVMGVFLSEPVSNVIGGLASFLTMYFTVYRKLKPQNTALPER